LPGPRGSPCRDRARVSSPGRACGRCEAPRGPSPRPFPASLQGPLLVSRFPGSVGLLRALIISRLGYGPARMGASMVGEVLQGVWRFESVHPDWVEEDGGEDGWERNVAWFAVSTPS